MNSITGGVHHFDRNSNPRIYDPKRDSAAIAMMPMYISLENLFIMQGWFVGCVCYL